MLYNTIRLNPFLSCVKLYTYVCYDKGAWLVKNDPLVIWLRYATPTLGLLGDPNLGLDRPPELSYD